jgi:hypothetical protein
MIDLRPFEPSDLAEIELQPQQAAEMAALGDWRALGEALLAAGPAWTAQHRGRMIGCGGVGVMWRGRAEAWCFVAAGVPRRLWPAVHRTVVRTLDGVAREIGLRRIEASCAYGWPPGRRWLHLLGFREEGLARCYGPDGSDFWRFARISA